MAEQQNPFANILMPETLSAQRQAQFEADYGQANPWVKLAAKAGFDLNESQKARGIGLTPEDVKAQRNQKILQTAQKVAADAMSSGGFSAEEAQSLALEKAIQAFSEQGDYEAAMSLAEPLHALKNQALERRKLKAEAINLEAKPELTEAQAQAKLAEIDTKAAQAQAAVDRATAAMQNAASLTQYREGQLSLAAAELEIKRLKLEAEKAKGEKGIDKTSATYLKQALNLEDQVIGAADATNLMAGIVENAIKDPAVLTQAGPWTATIQGLASSMRAAMSANDYDVTKIEEEARKSLESRGSLSSQTQAQILDLAFAFARVRDPGGRLSNQDVQMALEIVTGKGDPKARLETLNMNYRNMMRKMRTVIESRSHLGFELSPSAAEALQNAAERYDVARKATVKQPKAAGAAPATARDRLEALKTGGQ